MIPRIRRSLPGAQAAVDPASGIALQELKRTDVYTLRRIVPQDRNLSWEKGD